MNYFEEPDFNPGAVRDRVDTRDYQWSEIGYGSAPFDWEADFDIEQVIGGKLPVKDQGPSGSCGGQAWAYLACALEAAYTSKIEERSARFIYAQTYQKGGGSAGRDNANVYKNQGVAHETVLPSYDNGQPPSEAFMERGTDITDAVRKDAKTDLSSAFANVSIDIDTVAQAMRDNKGIILGVSGQNNGTWLSEFPAPPSSDQWDHWIFGGKAALINGKKHIGFLNSWGKAVGNNGWQWLSEDYFLAQTQYGRAVWQAWTHVFNPSSLSPQPPFQHTFNQDLRLAMSGADVQALQTALKAQGAFPANVPCTGYFGNITYRAVVKFQSANRIPATGFVGPITRAKLNTLFA